MTDWSKSLERPIELPDGGTLTTLRDAATYVTKLPPKEQKHPAWQLAGEILLAAAEGRDFTLHARIAVLRALHKDEPPPPRPEKPSLGDKWRARKAAR